MSKYDDKTNNEILIDIKQMEIDYENLKQKMVSDWDRLMDIEKDFAEANKVIMDRLKGNKNG